MVDDATGHLVRDNGYTACGQELHPAAMEVERARIASHRTRILDCKACIATLEGESVRLENTDTGVSAPISEEVDLA